jgi:hypothetical protein
VSAAVEPLLRTDADRARFQVAALAAASRRNDAAAAIDAAFALFDGDPRRFAVDLESPRRQVRLDRWVQAQLVGRIASATPESRTAILEQIADRLKTGIAAGDRLAARGYARYLDHLPPGQRLRCELPATWTSAREFAATQLALRQQAGIADATLSAAARRALADLLAAHGDTRDAAETYRALLDDAAHVVLPDGLTPEEIVAAIPDDSPLKRAIGVPSGDPWPRRAPRQSVRSWPLGDVYFLPVALRAESRAALSGFNVQVDRLGSGLRDKPPMARFSGAGMSRPWTLPLPNSNSTLRAASVAPDLRRAWAWGNVVVLQVGADVFGIAPFDVNGEPQAELLWPSPGTPVTATDELRHESSAAANDTLPQRIAAFQEATLRTDAFGHRLGEVGPVRPGYFCIQRRGMLVARETATGQWLWTKYDVPPGTRCVGDDRHVVLIGERPSTVEVVSALDGSTVEAREWDHRALLTASGCNVLVDNLPALPQEGAAAVRDGDTYRLDMIDLVSGHTVWSHEFAAGAGAFPIDSARCGVVEPGGAIHFVSLADGTAALVAEVDCPNPLLAVDCVVDQHYLFVSLSGAIDDPALLRSTRAAGLHLNDGYRRRLVNGVLCAFDRRTSALLWQRPFENVVLPLDQVMDVPILFCNESRAPAGEQSNGAFEGRIRCFDKRTGELLYDWTIGVPNVYFAVERNLDGLWVELRLPGQIVRFDYSEPMRDER